MHWRKLIVKKRFDYNQKVLSVEILKKVKKEIQEYLNIHGEEIRDTHEQYAEDIEVAAGDGKRQVDLVYVV